jgi:GDP-L-fucose synthase
MSINLKNCRVLIAGNNSLVGSSLSRLLHDKGCKDVTSPSPCDCDFSSFKDVRRLFVECKPEVVFSVAGRSGGIDANRNYPADLMLDNLLAISHIFSEAHKNGVRKLLYLGASCIYPKDCQQPMRPDLLWAGPMEPTSLSYSTAKIAGVVLAKAFRQQYGSPFVVGIPADIYGPIKSVDFQNAHVIPSVMAKVHKAKMEGAPVVELWGSGNPVREFLYADDLAEACLRVMEDYDSDEPINLGGGVELTIRQAAEMIAKVVGYNGNFVFDTNKPDGSPRKTLDSSELLKLGWRPKVSFEDGLRVIYRQTFLGLDSFSA